MKRRPRLDGRNEARLTRELAKRGIRDTVTLPDLPGAVLHVSPRCAWDGKDLGRHHAHAHNGTHRAYGLICIRPSHYAAAVQSLDTLGPGMLLWHEYAHLVTPGGHTAAWRILMREYGFETEAETYRARYASSRKLEA